MAINFVRGQDGVGDGKSYLLTNHFLPPFLRHTDKHVYTTLPCDGEEREFLLAWCFPERRDRFKRQAAGLRLHHLYEGEAEWFQEFWLRPVKRAEILQDVRKIYAGFMPPYEVPVAWDRENEMAFRFQPVDLADDAPEYLVRAEWPINDEMRARYETEGYVYRREVGGKSCRLRKYWHHTPAGAVIMLDEIADVFGAEESNLDKKRKAAFNAHLRQHRHYKYDLYFCAQNSNDITPPARRLFEREFFCRNLKKVPMIDHWSCRGMRWPVQGFECREFLAVHTSNKSGEAVLSMKSVDSFRVFPAFDGPVKFWLTGRGFKNYRSFSAASGLPGKAMADEQTRSGALDTPWERVKGAIKGLWKPIAVLGFCIMGGCAGLSLVYTMAGADSGKVGRLLYGVQVKTNQIKSVNVGQQSTNHAFKSVAIKAVGTNETRAAGTAGTNAPPVERAKPVWARFAGPDFIRLSDGALVRLGDNWPGRGFLLKWSDYGAFIANDQGGKWIEWGVLFQSR
jgi:hypothetical protein